MKIMMYGLPALTLIFTWWLPAALQLSFFVSGLLSFFQASLFKAPWFRSYFNMTPLLEAPTPGQKAPSPYKGTMNVRAKPVIDATYTKADDPPPPLSKAKQGVEGAGRSPLKVLNPKKVLDGAMKDIMSSYEGARKTVTDLKERGEKKMEQRNEKSDREAAERYEKKRQEEIRRERWERENERRAERAARRMNQK
jgi:YidC/Oxa1 family membrane protein insertase